MIRVWAAGLALAALLFACGSPVPSVTPRASSQAPPVSAGPVATPTAPAPASPSPTPAGTDASVPYDESLLEVLPATIADLDVLSTPEIAAEVGGDPQLQAIAEGFAAGVIADDGSGELAIAMLVQLRSGVFADEFFRDYRDTYDDAACAQAGGVVGNAEAEIGGYRTFITSCVNGARTYHTHVEVRDLLVSVTAADGPLRLGERVIEALPG